MMSRHNKKPITPQPVRAVEERRSTFSQPNDSLLLFRSSVSTKYPQMALADGAARDFNSCRALCPSWSDGFIFKNDLFVQRLRLFYMFYSLRVYL